jgi:hypothetical protein
MLILDAKYEKANKDANINTIKHLSRIQQCQMKALIPIPEHLFDGDWNTSPLKSKLKEGVKPFQLTPFSVPNCLCLFIPPKNLDDTKKYLINKQQI